MRCRVMQWCQVQPATPEVTCCEQGNTADMGCLLSKFT